MVGTYKYEIPEYVLNLHLHTADTYNHVGKWEVKEDLVVLHFDEHKDDALQVHELDKYVMKENEVWKDLIEQVVKDVVG